MDHWQTKFKACDYSNKLIKKILYLNTQNNNTVDVKQIKKSIYYARKYHDKQKRDTGEPYYSHPIEVASMVSDYLFNTDTLITCILHDTIEDTIMTKDIIASIFSLTIANNVFDLTRIKTNQKISVSENIKALHAEGKNDLLLIKVFDRLHNLQTLSVKPLIKITKIAYETLIEFIILSMYLGQIVPNMLTIEEKITKICYQHISRVLKQSWYDQSLKQLIGGDVLQHFSPTLQNDIDQKHNQY